MTEDEIRDLLDAQARQAPVAGELPPAVRRRAVRRRRLRLAGASLAVLALAGTGTGLALTVPSGQTSSLRIATEPGPSPAEDAVDETGAVPWVDRPAPPYVPPSPLPTTPPRTDARPCRASDVSVKQDGGNGAGGTTLVYFSFANVSQSTCLLQGYPRVVASSADKPDVVAKRVVDPLAAVTPANMPPGGHTGLGLETYRDCDARYVDPAKFPRDDYQTLTFALPGGGVVKYANANLDVLCGLGAGQFSVPQPAPSFPKPPLSGATVNLELPASVRAGNSLHYVVSLTNPTGNAMRLDPCPGYQASSPAFAPPAKAPSKIDYGLLLNCDAVHALAAHQTVRFAMQLPVPAETPSGQATIYWQIAGLGVGPNVSTSGTVYVIGADTPCRADQLTLTIPDPASTIAGGPVVPGKGTSTTVSLVATNHSTNTCSVRGRPTFSLVDDTGAKIGARYADTSNEFDRTPPPVTTVSLAPGKSATATLYWDLGCGPAATTVHLSLPATGESFIVTPVHGWPPPKCWSDNEAGALAADPFHAAPATATR